MRQEQKRQIQEAVLNSIAPAYTGQVSLEDVARAFTGRGSIEEIEECLDDLAKQGRAEKTVVMGHTYYVFQSIAGEAASRNEKRLVEIQHLNIIDRFTTDLLSRPKLGLFMVEGCLGIG